MKTSKTATPWICFSSAYLNICRWIAVIDCHPRLECKHQWDKMNCRPDFFLSIISFFFCSGWKWMETWREKKKIACSSKWMFTNDRIKRIQNNLTQFSASFSSSQTILSANRSYFLCYLCLVLFVFVCIILFLLNRDSKRRVIEWKGQTSTRTHFPRGLRATKL